MDSKSGTSINLVAGFITGLILVIDCISMAALVFSAGLSEYLPVGIVLFLISSVVIGLIVGIASTFPGNVAHPKNISAAIIALIGAAAVTAVPAPELLPTVIFVIVLSSLLTGLFFFVIGRLSLGSLTRYIPYPVIGGFLAGTGWLIVSGSFNVLVGKPLRLDTIPFLFRADALALWLPGLIFAVALIALQRRRQHFMNIPVMMFSFILLFYLYIGASGNSIDQAFEKGWLMGPFPEGGIWEQLDFSSLQSVNWAFISGEVGNIMAIMLLSTMSLLMNYTGLELSTQHEIDLNRELRLTGVANMASGLLGGPIGYNSFVFCVMNHKAGATGRSVIYITTLVCGISIFAGASVFAYIPRAAVGGFLLSLGFGFLLKWLYDSRKEVSRTDYILVATIMVLIATLGFLEGVSAGIILAIFIFIVNYSRIGAFKYVLTGKDYRSTVDRSPACEKILSENGEQTYITKLQGFIFFGTAYNIYTQVRERIDDPDLQRLQFVIFDFALVNGIDSSAIMSFEKIKRHTQQNQITIMLTNLSDNIQQLFIKSGFLDEKYGSVIYGMDLDYSLEFCEDKLLANSTVVEQAFSLKNYLSDFFPEESEVSFFMEYLEKIEVPSGHVLMKQGDLPDEMYFIEGGSVSVELELDSRKRIRLRSMGPGTIVGEVGTYLKSPRSATVVTTQPSTVYRLSVKSLEEMQASNPALVSHFHRFIVLLLSERLVHSNNMLNEFIK